MYGTCHWFRHRRRRRPRCVGGGRGEGDGGDDDDDGIDNDMRIAYKMTPRLWTLLLGARDDGGGGGGEGPGQGRDDRRRCPLSLLRGHEDTVLRHVASYMDDGTAVFPCDCCYGPADTKPPAGGKGGAVAVVVYCRHRNGKIKLRKRPAKVLSSSSSTAKNPEGREERGGGGDEEGDEGSTRTSVGEREGVSDGAAAEGKSSDDDRDAAAAVGLVEHQDGTEVPDALFFNENVLSYVECVQDVTQEGARFSSRTAVSGCWPLGTPVSVACTDVGLYCSCGVGEKDEGAAGAVGTSIRGWTLIKWEDSFRYDFAYRSNGETRAIRRRRPPPTPSSPRTGRRRRDPAGRRTRGRRGEVGELSIAHYASSDVRDENSQNENDHDDYDIGRSILRVRAYMTREVYETIRIKQEQHRRLRVESRLFPLVSPRLRCDRRGRAFGDRQRDQLQDVLESMLKKRKSCQVRCTLAGPPNKSNPSLSQE